MLLYENASGISTRTRTCVWRTSIQEQAHRSAKQFALKIERRSWRSIHHPISNMYSPWMYYFCDYYYCCCCCRCCRYEKQYERNNCYEAATISMYLGGVVATIDTVWFHRYADSIAAFLSTSFEALVPRAFVWCSVCKLMGHVISFSLFNACFVFRYSVNNLKITEKVWAPH